MNGVGNSIRLGLTASPMPFSLIPTSTMPLTATRFKQGPKTHRARGVVSLGFLSWWAIAGAPYVALPLAQRSNRAMLGITVGCRRFEDRLALDIAARLEEIIAGIRD